MEWLPGVKCKAAAKNDPEGELFNLATALIRSGERSNVSKPVCKRVSECACLHRDAVQSGRFLELGSVC